jgi:hypothetical protein
MMLRILRLIVGATGTRKWVFRFMRRGGRTEPDRRGATRQGGASDVRAGCGRIPTKVSEWRNSKHRAQWNMTLEYRAVASAAGQ